MIETSIYHVALRLEGMKEKPGDQDEPFILWALSLCGLDGHDETPWCSAFMNAVCYVLGLPRSGSAAARSWLAVGAPGLQEQGHLGGGLHERSSSRPGAFRRGPHLNEPESRPGVLT